MACEKNERSAIDRPTLFITLGACTYTACDL
jgi:hypothetical protein